MAGENDLNTLLRAMKPTLNEGEYVFCAVTDPNSIDLSNLVGWFKEQEGCTIIVHKAVADQIQLPYDFVASWITLTVHSSLQAIGFTAAFSKALADHGISCNVIAGYYHDHIFVATKDAEKAMEVLSK